MSTKRRRRRSPRPPEEAVQVEIESLSAEGRGIAHVDDRIVFVDQALAGETVLFKYTKLSKNIAEGRATEILKASPDRVKAKCMDGHVRVCRIRGKMKKRVWIRPNDILIVVPWEFQTDEKADIVWRYSRGEADYLRRKGFVVD